MDDLLIRRDGALTRVTLNRAAKANALSAELVEALLAAVQMAHEDGTRLLVLDGAGRHFCAGFDFGDLEALSDGDLVLRFLRIETLLQALYHAPFATLALAHGRVLGAGADLVACCHTRIAAPDAQFRMPGLRFGVVLGTQRLAQRIGGDAARALLGTTRHFDTAHARDIGFITAVVEPVQWPQAVDDAQAASLALSAAAATALYRQTTPDTRAADMAALAQSVSVPGLRRRIQDYRSEK